jgi:FkbM family methyltransferase
LTNNIQRNRFQDRVTVVPAAVLDKSGPVEFFIGPSTGMGKVEGSAGRDSVEYNESVQVEGISIDEYIELSGNPPAHIIKVDIEGGEILAIPGMQKLLHNQRPIVMIELHGPEAAGISWEILKKENYRICQMASSFPEIHDFQDLDWKSYIVAFPND